MSADGKAIVYEENFGLCKLDVASGESKEIKITIVSDDRENARETLASTECDTFSLSPSAKRAVISTHGELFTIATDRGDVRRLTQTPDVREVQPTWSPDGKLIAFVADQGGRDEVWLGDEQGKNLRKVSDEDSQKGSLTWSPDSKYLLYTGSDKKLHKVNVAGGENTVVAGGDVVGFGGVAIQSPQFSPDGKWISFTRADQNLLPHVFITPADGGAERRITDATVYSDSNALWTADGKKLVFLSGTDTGNIGQAGRSTAQIYVLSLQPEEKDLTDRSIDSEEQALAAEREQRQRGRGLAGRPNADQAEGGGDVARPADRKVEVKIDFDRMDRRTRQLTRVGDAIGAMLLAPDGRTLVFATSGVEGGRRVSSLWSIGLDGDRQTRVTQSTAAMDEEEGPPRRGFGGFGGFANLQFAKDGRTLYYRSGGGVYAVTVNTGAGAGTPGGDGAATAERPRGRPTGDGAPAGMAAGAGQGATPRRINFTARVEVEQRAERKQVFNEAWRVMKHRFYDPGMHGVDWDRMKATYEPLLDYVADRDDLHDVVSMMIGELNASHTGISGGGRGGREERQTQPMTRHPGFDLEPDASGFYKVTYVYKGGPADKDYVKIKVGDFVLAVDDRELKAGDNYWQHFTTPAGNRLEFTVNSKPAPEGAWRTKVTPVSIMQFANLQYEKWVDDRRALVDKLSGGTIGYLHIRQMNEGSLRQFERDLARQHDKKAFVIDQRFNPGGGIDQELLQILGQRQYQYTRGRDSVRVTRPLRGFFGPLVVMQNERSTSDAEVFPDGFRTLKLGKVVGVTTYGAVIGTGAYQLLDGSSIRTPGSGLWNVNGTNLENYGVPPDVYVDNTPEDFLKGHDAQLAKAVEVLKEEVTKRR
jgi:tricorn protease